MLLKKAYTLREIAKILNSDFIGDADSLVKGINEIHMVKNGDITFVDHPKYYRKVLNSEATTIIINSKLDCPKGKNLIFSDDPFKDYVSLVKKFFPFQKTDSLISDSSCIGEGSIIQPNVFVGNNVVIGSNCIIHSNVSIYDGTIIGDNVIIHSNSVIGADAYYFQKKDGNYRKLDSCGRVVIGNDVEIGALCSIDRGVSGDTVIDSGSKFDNHVQVGHDTQIGKKCLIGCHTAIAGVCKIEDEVLIWGRVSIDKDLVVGKGAVILATSAVGKSIKGNGKVYFGVPAKDARTKWKEIALLSKLPEIIEQLNKE